MKQQIGDKVDENSALLRRQNTLLEAFGRELFRQNTITEGILRSIDGIGRRLSSSAPQLGQQVHQYNQDNTTNTYQPQRADNGRLHPYFHPPRGSVVRPQMSPQRVGATSFRVNSPLGQQENMRNLQQNRFATQQQNVDSSNFAAHSSGRNFSPITPTFEGNQHLRSQHHYSPNTTRQTQRSAYGGSHPYWPRGSVVRPHMSPQRAGTTPFRVNSPIGQQGNMWNLQQNRFATQQNVDSTNFAARSSGRNFSPISPTFEGNQHLRSQQAAYVNFNYSPFGQYGLDNLPHRFATQRHSVISAARSLGQSIHPNAPFSGNQHLYSLPAGSTPFRVNSPQQGNMRNLQQNRFATQQNVDSTNFAAHSSGRNFSPITPTFEGNQHFRSQQAGAVNFNYSPQQGNLANMPQNRFATQQQNINSNVSARFSGRFYSSAPEVSGTQQFSTTPQQHDDYFYDPSVPSTSQQRNN
uniref:Uncharacterized protein n=1 Tax=Meloidogyne incognita TaxID=6306 RepID=A0A914LSL8_MELIC